MKHSVSWWLVRSVFLFVLFFTAGLFYQYWRLTRENQIIETPVISPGPVSKNSVRSDSDIKVLANYPIPTVYATGALTDYQFRQNPETNKNELYAVLSTQKGLLPARIDNITMTGRIPVYIFVKDLNEEEKKQIIEILNDGKAGGPLVDSTYVILSSIGSQDQVKMCNNNFPEAGSDWCAFDPAKKSYSSDELLAQVKKYLSTDSVKIGSIDTFSEYLYLEGNISLTLQVNYHYEPK